MHAPATIEANGLRFAYLAEGDGPLVLLLHGFPDTPHGWDNVRPRLAAKGYRVVAPFLRGYAPSALPARDADMLTLAEDVSALVTALGEKRAIVVGHDWGAVSAYGAAAIAPEKLTKLVTVAIPHPIVWKPTLARTWAARHFFASKLPGASKRFAANDFAGLRELYARWSPTWAVPDEELSHVKACFADRRSLEAAFGYYRAMPLLRPPAHLRRPILVPTLAFAGLDDTLAKPADYEAARFIHRAEYAIETMPGGHFMHREHPDTFADRLERYLGPASR